MRPDPRTSISLETLDYNSYILGAVKDTVWGYFKFYAIRKQDL